jgi:selenocysteine-specific translation elongation factor
LIKTQRLPESIKLAEIVKYLRFIFGAVVDKEQIQIKINNITNHLKQCGISNIERLFLNEDRKDLRAMLKQLEAKEKDNSNDRFA